MAARRYAGSDGVSGYAGSATLAGYAGSVRENNLGVMSKLPTDREVMRCIYETYSSAYPGPTLAAGGRHSNDPFVPVDLRAVAIKLNMQPELLFGRLYYQLEAKHRYQQSSGAWVNLFLLDIQSKGHSVNFPYLAALLAGHDQEHRRQLMSFVFSLIAIGLSLASLIVSALSKR